MIFCTAKRVDRSSARWTTPLLLTVISLSPISQSDPMLNFMGGGSSQNNYQNLDDPCGFIDLSPQTWVDLGIDEYLKNYPNADQLTIQGFAAELGVPNFYCGVGMECQAGQLCSPAKGINWMILYAVQQWNNYMNSLFLAVENAVTLMREASSSIVSDFTTIEKDHDSIYGWSVATVVCGVLGTVTAIAVPAFLPADAVLAATAAAAGGAGLVGKPDMLIGHTEGLPKPGQEAFEAAKKAIADKDIVKFDSLQDFQDAEEIRNSLLPPSSHPGSPRSHSPSGSAWTPPEHEAEELNRLLRPTVEDSSDQHKPSGSSSGGKAEDSSHDHHRLVRRALGIKHKKGPASPYDYTRYAYMEAHLDAIQNRIQGFVAVTTRIGVMAPLLAEGGLASVLQQGSYLIPNPPQNQLEQAGKELVQITALGQLFQSLKFFVTIGSDECKGKGPNGAWAHEDNLSYCSPEGLMRNIIQSVEDKAVNEIQNAKLVLKKYGYTTAFLTQSAWDCQKKYGVYTNSTAPPPSNMKSDCIFPLPVCDCTLPEVDRLRKSKKSTVVACRIGANLPI